MPHQYSPSLRKPDSENFHYSSRRSSSCGGGGSRQGYSAKETEGDGFRGHTWSRNQRDARESTATGRDLGYQFWKPGYRHSRPDTGCRRFFDSHGLKGVSALHVWSRLLTHLVWACHFERFGRIFSVKASSKQTCQQRWKLWRSCSRFCNN